MSYWWVDLFIMTRQPLFSLTIIFKTFPRVHVLLAPSRILFTYRCQVFYYGKLQVIFCLISFATDTRGILHIHTIRSNIYEYFYWFDKLSLDFIHIHSNYFNDTRFFSYSPVLIPMIFFMFQLLLYVETSLKYCIEIGIATSLVSLPIFK